MQYCVRPKSLGIPLEAYLKSSVPKVYIECVLILIAGILHPIGHLLELVELKPNVGQVHEDDTSVEIWEVC